MVKISQLESEAKNRRDRENASIWLAEGQGAQVANRRQSSEERLLSEDEKNDYLRKIKDLENANSDLKDKLETSAKQVQEALATCQALRSEQSKTKDENSSLQAELDQLQDSYSKLVSVTLA